MQAKGDSVEAADFCASAGDALDFRDHAASDKTLKRVGRDIPEPRDQTQDAGSGKNQQVLPPPAASRPAGGISHRVCSPPSEEAPAAGKRTSLSERKVCSQE